MSEISSSQLSELSEFLQGLQDLSSTYCLWIDSDGDVRVADEYLPLRWDPDSGIYSVEIRGG